MSKSSKSPNQAKSSSSTGSVCPPTARSNSMMTAESLTDPGRIPTAMPNSVNTAIGPSDYITSSGFSDTSAGSGRNSSKSSTPLTAKAPTSPELIMNDLRRGNLFGRQSTGLAAQVQNQQPIEHPPSFTNVTFMSTASQQSSVDGKPLEINDMSEMSESTKTGIPLSNGEKSGPRGRSANSGPDNNKPTPRKRSPADRMIALKKQEEKQKQLEKTQDFSKKSAKKSQKSIMKSRKSAKKVRHDAIVSRKSKKSAKRGAKAVGDIEFPSKSPRKSKKSIKSIKSTKKQAPPTFEQSGVVKKGDGVATDKNKSVYLPGVMDNTPTANKFMKKPDPSQKSVKSSRKFNQTPAYNFPGAGKCTRNMEHVAPPTPKQDQSHCVYDVTQLPPAQRRFPTNGSAGKAPPPKTLFGKSAPRRSVAAPVALPAPIEATPTGSTVNKIVVLGKTADGKNTIQMTIQMQIIAGEALSGTDQPIDVIPQKIILGGKQFSVDGVSSESKRDPKKLIGGPTQK